jgi:HK97 family phage portal protein
MGIKQLFQRWFGSTATMYEPGTGRIVSASNLSASGVQVTLETALAIPAFFHGLRTIGQTVGTLDFDVIHHLVEKNDEGIEQRRQEIARAHPVHILLHSEPNEFQNASEWRETMVAHAISTGNGFSYIERNGNFRPTALLPLMPNVTKPQVIDGKLVYITTVNGEQIIIEPWNIFHVKGFSWNGVAGIPLVHLMRNALGLDIAQTGFAQAFYGNGASMDGVVEVPGTLSDTARQNLKSSMKREYSGVANAFRTLFLEEGMKYQKLGVEPDKAQFIEGRKFSLGDMARVIGLPPHLLYDLSQSTNNNIEHQGIEAVQYAFKPWTNKFTQEANRKLLYESEKFEYSTRLDTKPLMAGDSTAQAARDTARFQCLAVTPNEIRAEDGRNPIAGGDSTFLNTAYLPLATAMAKANAGVQLLNAKVQAGKKPAPVIGVNAEVDEDDDTPPAPAGAGVKPADGLPGPEVPAKLIEDERTKIIRPVLRDALSRLIKRETRAVETALKKHADNPPALREWLARWEQEHRQHIAEVLQPASECAAAAGRPMSAVAYTDRHISQSRADLETIIRAGPEIRADAQWSMLNAWQQDRLEQSINQITGDSK